MSVNRCCGNVNSPGEHKWGVNMRDFFSGEIQKAHYMLYSFKVEVHMKCREGLKGLQ